MTARTARRRAPADTASAPSAAGNPTTIRPRTRQAVAPGVVLAVAALGVFMEFVDSTIVNIAFPAIHRSFHETTISTLSWILNAYSIVFAAFLVVSGRLADLLGRRKLFRSGVVLFTLASALCGLAPSPGVLIATRALQALGGAMVVPSSMALVIHAFPVERRGRATTIYGATAALAAALGPPIGGALIKLVSWRLCFYINVPVGILVLVLSSRLLVESRSPGRRLVPDLIGALLLAAGLGLLTLGIVRGTDWGWSNPRIVGAFVLAAAAASLFAWRSTWHRSPIIDPAVIRTRPFQAVNGAMLLAGAGFYAYLLCHALFLMLVWRYSALVAGLCFVPGALTAAATAGASRRLEERGFAALVVPGALLWAGGMLWYVKVVGLRPEFVSQWLPGSIITGIGSGLVLPALGAAAIAATPGTGYAMAGALNTTARQVGGALGIATVVVLIGGVPTPTSLRHGWMFSTALFAVVMVGGVFLGRLRPAHEAITEDDPPPTGRLAGLAQRTRPAHAALSQGSAQESAVLGSDSVAAFLGSVPIFATLSPEQVEDIAAIAGIVRVNAGEYLFRRGDPVDGLYVLRAGRVEVLLKTRDEVVRKEVGRGEVLGELALLAEPRRSATVQAKRDSELIHIARADFERLLLEVPGLALSLASRLARLVQRRHVVDTGPHSPLPVTIAVLAGGGDPGAIARELGPTLGGSVAMFDGLETHSDWTAMLDHAEREHDRVLLVAQDPAAEEWWRFCVAQADTVLIAGAGRPPERLSSTISQCTVVLDRPHDIRAWVRGLTPVVDHVVSGTRGTAAIARRLTGRSTGLVLSGGGARALAHVGVIEELERQDVTVDRVAGAGTGSLVAAMLASGWTASEVDAACYEELVRRKPFSGYRLTRTSLIRGERLDAMLDRLFGDVWIEELPLEFACVSADLVRGERVTHRRGPLAEAVLAAISTPGLMAPVPVGDRLLVDAGGLDNLPIDVLESVEGPIIAVDVAPRERGPERVERSRAPRRGRGSAEALPTIAEALARAMVLGSCDSAESARQRASVSVVPDTVGVGMLEYHQLDVLRAAGRAAARAAFEL